MKKRTFTKEEKLKILKEVESDDYSAQTEPPIPRQSEPLVLREKE